MKKFVFKFFVEQWILHMISYPKILFLYGEQIRTARILFN